MTKEKQIEEMAKALTSYEYKLCEKLPKDKCLLTSATHAQVSCDYCKIAEFLVNAGYRKASEIFEEIEEAIMQSNEISDIRIRELAPHTYTVMREAGKLYYTAILKAIAELKKKYIGKDTNVTTNTEGER